MNGAKASPRMSSAKAGQKNYRHMDDGTHAEGPVYGNSSNKRSSASRSPGHGGGYNPYNQALRKSGGGYEAGRRR